MIMPKTGVMERDILGTNKCFPFLMMESTDVFGVLSNPFDSNAIVFYFL